MQTRCMAACIGQIRLQGLVELNKDGTWKENRHSPLYYLVHVAKVALPLYPQFGTEPNGYYIPPRWAPRAYLRQMFGPRSGRCDRAIQRSGPRIAGCSPTFRQRPSHLFPIRIKQGPKVFETEVNGKKFELL